LGVVLYEMVSGRLPFLGDSEAALAYNILHAEPEPLTALRSGVSIELDRISAKALAKEPSERFQHVDDMLTDLHLLRRSLSEESQTRSRSQPNGSHIRRHYIVISVALLLVVLAAVGIWFTNHKANTAKAPKISDHIRIAVLPLENLSGVAEQDYFSDGMTDALISELGSVSELRVTSWTSVARYKHSKPALTQIAAELGVSHVLEGAVLQSDNQVRISARLIAADRDEQLWARTFERAIEDVLALQREVARTVVNEVGVQLDPRLQARLQSAPTANREAYMTYLQGVQLSFFEPAKALERYQKAVELDPNFALARASLALSYSQGGPGTSLANMRIELGRRAAEEARRVLELDENNEVAYNALGWVHTYFEYDWTAAERAFQKALELNPSSADANHRYSHYLMMMGRTEEALQCSRRARELNPFSPGMVAHHVWTLYMARRYEEAVQYAESILQANPDNYAARRYSYPAYAQLRRFEPILSLKEPEWVVLKDLVQAHMLLGDERSALEAMAKMRPSKTGAWQGAYHIALGYVALGDHTKAFEWLERAYENRAFPLPEISIDVRFNPLRGDDRFKNLLAKMGLRNAWREP
jgi:TolB-like protein/Flp pilus assembly protein TadD